MATTISSGFQTLKSNLEITGLQKATVSTRQQKVRKAVEKKLTVLDSFLTGSYSRSTMIAPLKEADIDIFTVLDPSYYSSDGQANLLDRVRRVLLKTYTKTPKISRNGQAVTITFTDFIVDVVPSFYRKDGGFFIPDSRQKTWIATDPKIHVKHVSQHNQTHTGDMVPIIKMVKRWNKNIGFSFESFYLELLCVNIFDGITISDFPSGMRYFFDKGREKIKYTVLDPARHDGQILGFRNVSSVDAAVKKFQAAYTTAVNAENMARNRNIRGATNNWRKIFGSFFPAYG